MMQAGSPVRTAIHARDKEIGEENTRMRRLMTFTVTAGVLLSASISACSQGNREIALFNGRDLSGWEYFLVDEGATMEDVWSVEEGILVCKGEPRGYLCTENDYESFRLVVEWRWPEEPGNSGVLMRITGEPAMLPNCVEAQLRSGSAGDMYGFNGFTIGAEGNRLPGIERNENEPGEWNRYEITADGGTITVMLNGMKVNEATGCDVRPGRIGLQSEGGVIHFRTVMLTPLTSE